MSLVGPVAKDTYIDTCWRLPLESGIPKTKIWVMVYDLNIITKFDGRISNRRTLEFHQLGPWSTKQPFQSQTTMQPTVVSISPLHSLPLPRWRMEQNSILHTIRRSRSRSHALDPHSGRSTPRRLPHWNQGKKHRQRRSLNYNDPHADH